MKRLFAWFKRGVPSLPGITVLVPALMLTFMGHAIAAVVTPDLLVSGATSELPPFAANQVNGISAVGGVVLYTRPFCQVPAGADSTINPRLIFQLHGDGSVTKFGQIPYLIYDGNFNTTCAENYIAIAPGQGAWAAKAGYVYVTQGDIVYELKPDGTNNGIFVTLPAGFGAGGHTGINFDTVGSFGYNMIVSGTGGVLVLDQTAALVTSFANPSPGNFLEAPHVAPLSFTPYDGWIFAGVDAGLSAGPGVYAFPPTSCLLCGVTNVLSGGSAPHPEAVDFAPDPACSIRINGLDYGYLIAVYDGTTWYASPETTADSSEIWGVRQSDMPPAGSLLVQDERNGTVNYFPTSLLLTPFINFGTDPGKDQEDATTLTCAPQGTGCPATKGFFHKLSHWPSASIVVGGVTYNGTAQTMTIGGITYTTAQLLLFLPTGQPPSGGNGYIIGGSQLIAAVLNMAAGAQQTTASLNAISDMNTALTGINMICGSAICGTPSDPLNTLLKNDGGTLDSYNNATGLNCTEGTGLTLGGS